MVYVQEFIVSLRVQEYIKSIGCEPHHITSARCEPQHITSVRLLTMTHPKCTLQITTNLLVQADI